MSLCLRKTLIQRETVFVEGGRAAPVPLKLYAAIAVITNPWAGRGFVENLKPEINEVAPALGAMLTDMIVDAVGSGDAVESYGRAVMVGLNGELEHSAALIHTLQFGNKFRKAIGAKSYLTFTNVRGNAGNPIVIPLMDKNDTGRRSHYLTIQTSIPDGPAADEIAVALGASVGGRPHHRIGDHHQDIKDMGRDASSPTNLGT